MKKSFNKSIHNKSTKKSSENTLSIIKFNKYIHAKKLTILKYYVVKNIYKFVQCITHKGEMLLINVPSKFYIPYNVNDKNNVVKLDIITKFDVNIKNAFTTSPVINVNNDNLQTLLNYKGIINLNTNVFFKNSLISITGQLSRLKMCTEYLDYKICIFYSNYFFVIDELNNIQSFYMDEFISYRSLYPIISLDKIFTKLKNNHKIVQNDINTDLSTIFSSLLVILNQIHLEQIKIIVHYFNDVSITNDIELVRKTQHLTILSQYKLTLVNTLLSEEQIENVLKTGIESGIGSFHSDIQKSYKHKFLQEKLITIHEIKKNLYENIIKLHGEFWNSILLIDEICFGFVESVNLLKEQQKELKKIISII